MCGIVAFGLDTKTSMAKIGDGKKSKQTREVSFESIESYVSIEHEQIKWLKHLVNPLTLSDLLFYVSVFLRAQRKSILYLLFWLSQPCSTNTKQKLKIGGKKTIFQNVTVAVF